MIRLIEFRLEDGGTFVTEVDGVEAEGMVRAARPGEIAERAREIFDHALDKIKPVATIVIAKLRDLKYSPEDLQVEFGLKLNGAVGALIASASTEANFKVTLTWRRHESRISTEERVR